MSVPAIEVTLFSLAAAICLMLTLLSGLEFLSRNRDFHSAVEIMKEGTWFLLNLALANSFLKDVWAEECIFSLSEFDGAPSKGLEAPCKGVLSIRELVRAGETLQIGLCRTVYEAAGRPQDEYGFVISGTLKYRIDDVWYSQPFQPRRVTMRGPHPIEVRGTERSAACASQLIHEPVPAYTSAKEH